MEGSDADAELCVRRAWPSQPRTAEQDHAGFVAQRLEHFPGLYRTGQRCRLLDDGSLLWTGLAATARPSASNLFPLEGPIGRA